MFLPFKHKGLALQPLPIEKVIPDLLHAIHHHCQILLQAAPGAGKSTLFPLRLLQQHTGAGKIIMLEPRRLATKSIAHFIAQQLGEEVGQRVGYRIKGEAKCSAKTQLEIVTEGVLTRMIQADPELNDVDIIIFDEFHERNLNTDLAFALALDVQTALRKDLKVVVMSATLDVQALQSQLPQAVRIECEGRTFPIEYRYAAVARNERMTQKMAKQIEWLIEHETGSILAFLPGQSAIKQVSEQLASLLSTRSDVDLCPLFGQLDFAAQQRAIAPSKPERRKIVLATNVAETSLTIEGIRIVVDSGLERVAVFDPNSGVTRLVEKPIAQSSAQQRAGRAGRLEEGICIRLYSESLYQQQPQVPRAAILQSDLANLAMELANWGVVDASNLIWLDPPPAPLLAQARALLRQLGMLTPDHLLSSVGQRAYELGLEPRLACMLILADRWGKNELNAAIAAAALVDQQNLREVDLCVVLHRWQQGMLKEGQSLSQRARQLSQHFGFCFELPTVSDSQLAIALALAYPDRIAQRRSANSEEFKLANGHGVFLAQDHLFSSSRFLLVVDLMRFQGAKSQILLAIDLDIGLLQDQFPSLFQDRDSVEWDEAKGRLVAEKQQRLGELIITQSPAQLPDGEKLTQALLDYVRRRGLSVLQWHADVDLWLVRVRCAANWLSEEPWPDCSDTGLLASLDKWLLPYMNQVFSLKQLRAIDFKQALITYLGWSLNQQLEEWLPEKWTLPTGNRAAIRYQEGAEPILAVRIQEVFGQQASPIIAKGTKPLVLELLSPAHRPIQVTRDLASFWAGSYKEVQKEMKGRYPKHLWPDDPANHVATSKTKRHFNS